MKATGEIKPGSSKGNQHTGKVELNDQSKKLTDLNITKDQSSQWQALATDLSESQFLETFETLAEKGAALLMQNEWVAKQRKAAKKRHSANGGDKESAAYKKSATQKVGEPIEDKHAGETNQKIAKASGTNRQYVAELSKLQGTDPDLFDLVRLGKMRVSKARRLTRRYSICGWRVIRRRRL